MATALLLFVGPGPTLAECTAADAWPSYRAVASTATQVYVGRVIGAGTTSLGALGFRIQVQTVLRGSVPDPIDFDELRPPAPLACPDSSLRPRIGDVFAVAVDGVIRAPDGRGTTVAYIEGSPHPFFGRGIEILSEREIASIVGLPPTDTDPDWMRTAGRDESTPIGLLLVVGLAAFLAVVARPARRPGEPGG